MIPKIIHYIWLGNTPLPKVAEKCIASWKKYCPDYEIMRWDESNIDLDKYKFCRDAYDAKKYAFASDVIRVDVLYNYGGIYLDIDVQLLKSIDELITNENCVLGFETAKYIGAGIFVVTTPQNIDFKNILDRYKNLEFSVDEMTSITIGDIFTDYYETKGLVREDRTQRIDGAVVYSAEYFSPIDVITNKMRITPNTYSIHWYNASWYSPMQRFKRFCKKVLNAISFGGFGIWLQKRREKRR